MRGSTQQPPWIKQDPPRPEPPPPVRPARPPAGQERPGLPREQRPGAGGANGRGPVDGYSSPPGNGRRPSNGNGSPPANGRGPGNGYAPPPGNGQGPANGYGSPPANGRRPANGQAPRPATGGGPANGYGPPPGNGRAPGNGYAARPANGRSPANGYASPPANGRRPASGDAPRPGNGRGPANGYAPPPPNGRAPGTGNGHRSTITHDRGPYTGPDTVTQLVALRELERIPTQQEPAYRYRPEGSPASRTKSVPVEVPVLPQEHDAGPRRGSPSSEDGVLRRHAAKFTSFSLIGGGIFVAGLLIQAVLTGGLHIPSFESYLVQAVVSVESSFLLNRWFTWRAARTPFWSAFWRFNAQKVITVTANLILYAGLLKLGMNYLLANILLTVVFTFVNYIGADRFVFLRGSRQLVAAVTGPLPVITGPMPVLRLDRQRAPRRRPVRRDLPSISVVIPVRGNEKTIRAAVDSIFGQDYPMLRELILVGSPRDSTWKALRDLSDSRLVILETETPPGIRDANFKRDLGIRETSGDLVSLIDSDMVIPRNWMSNAVRLLMENEVDCVAGVMRSIRDDFWGRFVDSNRLSAKTPRAKAPYLVTAEGFGAAEYKPPITADILFTRRMYDRCPIDSGWSHGSLEDYEWFWRVVESGHLVLVSNQLFGWHHHRAGFKKLSGEYRRSARGCAYFIRAHRESPFAQKRMAQAIVLPLTAFAVLLGLGAAAMLGDGIEAAGAILGLGVVGTLLLSVREFVRSHRLESLVYPIPALILGVNYTVSLVYHLIRSSPMLGGGGVTAARPAPNAVTRVDMPIRRDGMAMSRAVVLLIAVLVVGTALRLWHLGIFPAWQWDETVYYRVSVYVQHGSLTEHPLYGETWQPFLYQPPFFMEIEAKWFTLVGASIYHARLLGVACTAVMQVVLFRLLCRIHGARIALWTVVPVVFDGWLLYIERVSYIENALMILVVLGFLLYQRALDKPSLRRFLLAGLALGVAAIFKQTGAYVVVVAVLCGLVVHRNRKGHLVLLGAALAVIATYIGVMLWVADVPGHAWFLDQSLVQVRRVLGLQQSGGTLTSPVKALDLLTQQYKYFAASLVLALWAFGIAIRRTWQCLRARSWAPVRPNALLYSWLLTGMVVFGVSSLKYPQYFVLILLPAYCYLWTELARWDWRRGWQAFLVAAAVVAGIGSSFLAMPALSTNSLAEVQAYAAQRIPANAIVVTEQSIGDLIQQPWCTVEHADACLGQATYAITWQTYLQSSFTEGSPSFYTLMKGATSVATFNGAVGTATVWKLKG
jgi:4-amino-4-deoxy-L-arabinose transferase-like glycosyltransferase/glycosyltransferase involved in cell wall biosynthesis/putative flippase GtrA